MQTKEELRDQSRDMLERLFSNHPDPSAVKRYRLMHTSGTTGLPLPVLYTERPDWNPMFLGRGTRTLMLFGSKPLRLDFARSFADSDTSRSDIMFLTQNTAPAIVDLVCRTWRPDAVVSPPSVLLRFTRSWSAEVCANITSVILTGELESKAISTEIRARFPNALVENYYPATETGVMGYQCPACEWNEFHPHEGVKFSIHKPDDEGIGELLITKENPGGLTLREYRIGDVAREDSHEGARTFRLYGRQGFDYIKLGDALLLREEFDRVRGELEAYIDDYRAEVRTEIVDGAPIHVLALSILPNENATRTSEDLCSYLSEEYAKRIFVTPNSTLKDAIEHGIFAPLEVAIVAELVQTTAKPRRLFRIP